MFPIRTLISTKDGRKLRVIDVLADTQQLVTIDAEDSSAQPRIWALLELSVTAKEQGWKALSTAKPKKATAEISRRSVLALSSKAQALRDERWATVEHHLKDRRLYDRATRSAAIKEIATANGTSKVHIRQLIRLAWQGGSTPDALTPQLHECGRGGHDQKPRGRRPIHSEYVPFIWNDGQRTVASRLVRSKYADDRTVTVEATYDQLIRKHFSYVDREGEIQALPLGSRPTMRQLRSIVEAELTDSERHIARHSQADYDNNFKPTIGHVLQDCQGAGDVYELDASQVDNWIVAEEDRKTVIGKATMYLVVDRFSRLIVGFYISLDAASWASGTQAILSIFQDKRELCKGAGVQYDEADWPAHGLMPNRFFADRGEFVSQASDRIADGLAATVTNARALWSAGKGLVECSFKLTHISLKRLKAGYEPARNTKVRRGKKYETTAKMTLSDLRRKFLRIVIDHNRKAHMTYELPNADIRDGLLPIPREVFARSIRTHMGLSAHFDEHEVRFKLLQATTATVTQNGIDFGHCFYWAQEAEDRDWFTRAAVRGVFNVAVRDNPGLVDSIYIVDPNDSTSYFLATLTDYSARHKGLSRAEVHSVAKATNENKVKAEAANLNLRINTAAQDEAAGLTVKGSKAKRSPTRSPILREQAAREDRSVSQAIPAAPGQVQVEHQAFEDSNCEETSTLPASTNEDDSANSRTKASAFAKMFEGNDDDLE
ncbi:hypothetical protein [Aquabacterium sp.]|uniref:hypothetical protein n=1 Tax=Aquabacterium sp. TaxID=1872578 RepID=UPI0024874A0A|nr:hypothetical protein [Aquabacterium sp.]MDI1258292.1 hypothetical protein [Aquabacterium sp.]